MTGANGSAHCFKTIYDEFKIKPSSMTLWSDSKIVLHWLHSKSSTMKAFVGVRVTEIQFTWEPSFWRFFPTDLNPADYLSQGIAVDDIHGRWETGPDFLKKPPEDWPKDPNPPVVEDSERKGSRFLGLVSKVQAIIVDSTNYYSSWTRLTRVTAYILCFIYNVRVASRNSINRRSGPLQPAEIESAETYWIKEAQSSLTSWETDFVDLAPFLQDDIIRVGRHLRRSNLSYDEVHPVLLRSSHHISTLIMRNAHKMVFHASSERTLSESQR